MELLSMILWQILSADFLRNDIIYMHYAVVWYLHLVSQKKGKEKAASNRIHLLWVQILMANESKGNSFISNFYSRHFIIYSKKKSFIFRKIEDRIMMRDWWHMGALRMQIIKCKVCYFLLLRYDRRLGIFVI